jgi:CopG family transcriptional regulator, nickel-responsive regulator
VMRADVAEVRNYAERLFLERGIRHGALALVPVAEADHHKHDHDGEGHVHLKIQDTF